MWRNLCFPARSESLMDAAMSVVSRVHIKTRSVLDKKKPFRNGPEHYSSIVLRTVCITQDHNHAHLVKVAEALGKRSLPPSLVSQCYSTGTGITNAP